MARNALLDESKDVQYPVGMPGWCDKVRLSPSLQCVLDAARPVSQTKSDQLVVGALKTALIERIITGDFRTVYMIIGSLLGYSLPSREADEVRKPLHTSPARAEANGTHGAPVGKSLPSREVR